MSDLKLQTPPPTLNGYPVLGYLPRHAGGFVVLVYREGHFQPWVTAAWHPNGCGDSWCWGHYMEDEKQARQDLIDRASGKVKWL